MKLILRRTEPCQEIAAEPGTLNTLMDCLRPLAKEPEPSFGGAIGSLTGMPLVADPHLLPGVVHMRPVDPERTHAAYIATIAKDHPDV
ncbi:hypothetical protein AB0M87_04640 [Streptomyces sp. NPDC051320]|uniref:hypothetical protein n=1 Tax=Streptomyces sp. NPDC051320 TaxID=3154644 RepID=UPI0034424261